MKRAGAPVVAALTVHPPRIAATRLRICQYRPHLERAGLSLRLWTLLRDQDVEAWFGSSTVARLRVLLLGLLRVPAAVLLILRADVVIVHREVLPLGPPWIELFAARAGKLVWDVDDAVWDQHQAQTAGRVPRWVRSPGHKYARVCAAAASVWAGSRVLADWCLEHTTHVQVVPTVVDVPIALPARPTTEPTVGWIGTHSTGPFVAAVLPALADLAPPPPIVLVGAVVAPPTGLSVEQQPWSQDAEDKALRRLHVGLYPIDVTHPLAEGKCGLKAILYLAYGIPVVMTPTRTNAAIVTDGKHGLYARDASEWTAAVRALLTDVELAERLRTDGWRHVEEEYSVRVWGPRVADMLRELTAPVGATSPEI